MSKLDRIGSRHPESVFMALDIIESVILRSLEDKRPVSNFDYTVWDIRIRYFG